MMRLLTIALATLLLAAARLPAEVPKALIDSIRANEAKYQNVEVKWHKDYFWLRAVETRRNDLERMRYVSL